MSWIRPGRSKAGLRDGALCGIVLLGQKVGPFDDDAIEDYKVDMLMMILRARALCRVVLLGQEVGAQAMITF